MRLFAALAMIAMSEHGAASDFRLEQRSREIAAEWPRIGKGFTPNLFLKVFMPFSWHFCHEKGNPERRDCMKSDEEKRAYRIAYYAAHKDEIARKAKEKKARMLADPALHEQLKRKWRECAKRYYDGMRERHPDSWARMLEAKRKRKKAMTPEQKERQRDRNRIIDAKRRKNPAYKEKRRKWYHSGGGKEYNSLFKAIRYQELCAVWEVDPDAYAKHRRKDRERKERARGSLYKPRPACRIPDWAVKGQDVFDRRSVFLYQNLSDAGQAAAKGFARVHMIELHKSGFRY